MFSSMILKSLSDGLVLNLPIKLFEIVFWVHCISSNFDQPPFMKSCISLKGQTPIISLELLSSSLTGLKPHTCHINHNLGKSIS